MEPIFKYEFKEISEKDLNWDNDDSLVSEVCLSDYGWSTYTIKIQFQLADRSYVVLEEEYSLAATSQYKLKHIIGDNIEELEFTSISGWAERHLKQQLESHIANFDNDECPTNFDLCIEQYNEIVNEYRIVEANLPKRRTYKKGEEK